VLDKLIESGLYINCAFPTSVLVEALMARGADGEPQRAQAAIDRLAEVPIAPGIVLNELPLLRMRALLARAHGEGPVIVTMPTVIEKWPAPPVSRGTWRSPRR
jgi:adenylate cyclase